MKKLFLAGALLLAPSIAGAAQTESAQAAADSGAQVAAATPLPDANPAMWVVRDEDTTIYLFGTFHMLDGRPWFNDEVKAAFDSSDELMLEAIIPENLAELQPLVMRYAVDPNGRKLSARLSVEQNTALGEALSSIGIPAAAFDPLEPWFVSMTMVNAAAQRLGVRPEHGPEATLSRAARERRMPVSELEGVEWQLRLFDSLPEEQQLTQLSQTIQQLDQMDEQMAPMLAAWSTGDVEGLVATMHGSMRESPELHQWLFTRRNARWANLISQRMQRPGKVFIAVGAGHLAGPHSVQTLLGAYGFEADRVENAERPARSGS
ncbi:MAG TPA: TraB/GumN family protein [Allosphingosinicella sp.]|nr:TraB/GumN family protein [Allosphingosinicella sp.]